jgi:hypothetical protein
MNENQETHAGRTAALVGSGPLVRPVFVSVPVEPEASADEGPWPTRHYAEKTGWHHGWTQTPRCAVGDGSSIYHQTLAIVEMGDGKVEYVEPHLVRFLPNGPVRREPDNLNPNQSK